MFIRDASRLFFFFLKLRLFEFYLARDCFCNVFYTSIWKARLPDEVVMENVGVIEANNFFSTLKRRCNLVIVHNDNITGIICSFL